MKKFFALALVLISTVLLIPRQVKAIDIDVGYQFTLPADHSFDIAQATKDCQVVAPAPEFITVLHQDPGDMRSELRIETPGLREKSADRFNTIPLPNADVTYLNSRFRDQHGTSFLNRSTGYHIYNDAFSTSCGGIGY